VLALIGSLSRAGSLKLPFENATLKVTVAAVCALPHTVKPVNIKACSYM
jgi:hypothetical protein